MIENGLLSPKLEIDHGYLLTMYCPGCKMLHSIGIDHPNNRQAKWDWDGNVEAPTFSPSIKVHMGWLDKPGIPYICHSFVKAGQWHFLSDCTHDLANSVVDFVAIPENL